MRERLVRFAKLLAYPAFYLFCLALFGYLTFPYGRLKDRVIAEFEKHGKPGQRLEIGKLGAYWFTGVEVANVKLHLPPEDPTAAGFPGSADFAAAAAATAKESVIAIDEAHARVRFLPLLLGRVRLDFFASAFGGEIKGSAPVGSAKGDVEVQLDHVDISKMEGLGQSIGVPLKGTASGKLLLDAPDGKFNKANGTFELTISDVVVSDGKTKIQGLIELPPAKLGEVAINAEAKDGILKITKLSADGTDLEIVGDGKVTLREPWSEAVADIYVRFKFTDAYRGKNGTTKSLLGDPGSSVPGLMEMQVPKMKRAKRPDGFYGWHIYGPLKRLKFDPTTVDSGGPAGPTPAVRRGRDTPLASPKRPLLGGGATARDGVDLNMPSPPPHAVPALPTPAAEPARPLDLPSRGNPALHEALAPAAPATAAPPTAAPVPAAPAPAPTAPETAPEAPPP